MTRTIFALEVVVVVVAFTGFSVAVDDVVVVVDVVVRRRLRLRSGSHAAERAMAAVDVRGPIPSHACLLWKRPAHSHPIAGSVYLGEAQAVM